MRIGLFGGTFNPPHDAHRAACLLAMKRLGLDRVWWLVTPAIRSRTRAVCRRSTNASRRRARSPVIRASMSPASRPLGTHYTYRDASLAATALPGRALRLDHGRRQPAQLPPLAELARDRRAGADRGGRPSRARASTPPPASPARRLARCRIPEDAAATLPDRKPPAWVFLHGLKSPLSSTALRQHGKKAMRTKR